MQTGTEISTPAQMRAIESAAMASGMVTGLELMERAGRAVAGQIRLRWPRPGRATVLCGPGNNGGDGYVIARLLHQAGWQLRVLGPESRPGADAAHMRGLWRRIGPVHPLETAALAVGQDVIVDAVFGTGLTRAPDGPIAALLQRIAGDAVPVVAVDCPSGLCLDSGRFLPGRDLLRACLTVAFDRPKPGHLLADGPLCCGRLVIADIGLAPWHGVTQDAPATLAIHPRIETPWLPRPQGPDTALLAKQSPGHKFSNGHALVIAGGSARGGAARLAARAALRSGAGLVTICPPEDALARDCGPPDALMRHPVDTAPDLDQLLQDSRITGLCLGPGCGIGRAGDLLGPVLAARRPCVLDADALTALALRPRPFEALHDRVVLTPHAGEFARLFPDLAQRLARPEAAGPEVSRLRITREAAARAGCVLLLKGPDTTIAAPDGRVLIHSAYDLPWLATAGAGDVLAGVITALLARGLPALDAAGLGALLHGFAARGFGPGLIADDLPEQIPAALCQLAYGKEHGQVVPAVAGTGSFRAGAMARALPSARAIR